MKGLDLDLFFLGPKSEQRQFIQEALQLVLTDHIFWRRNYFPKDPPSIGYPVVEGDAALAYREKFFTELFSLISDLKLDVPVFSPRYMAHMISETTLPALVAYLATIFYNPNNVTSEASPVTIRYELEVGQQFAELFGFDTERSFGHLASGGTVANYESIWYNRAGRYLPVSIALARMAEGSYEGEADSDSLWTLLNVPLENVEPLLVGFLSESPGSTDERFQNLQRLRPSWLGSSAFQSLVSDSFNATWKDPVLIMPRTGHYSWSRAASLFGIGKSNVIFVDVDESFAIDPTAYRQVLENCLRDRIPVLQTVVVMGSTEFGSVDPLDKLVEIRDEMAEKGIYTPIHVDGAFGGYFATMFKSGTQHTFDSSRLSEPGRDVWNAYLAITRVESITVDPHKAGYVPYGAGGIILKNGFLKDVVAESAPYCLDSEDAINDQPQLGRFIMEGSKPGASAASTWFSHRLIPLNLDGYGRQLSTVCSIAQEFESNLLSSSVGAEHGIRLCSVMRPHTNIVCFYALPEEASSISEINSLNTALANRFGVKDVISIQSYDYLISHTTIALDLAWARAEGRLGALKKDAEHIDVLRLVFMNRWVDQANGQGKTYLEDFEETFRQEAARIWSGLCDENGSEFAE